jgi:acyl-CoA dehydrogenase
MDSETLDLLLSAVRRFCTETLRPAEAVVSETDMVPAHLVAEMKALGLFGLSIPEEYGGLGLSMEEEALVCMEVGRVSLAFRSVFGTNVGIGSQAIVMAGTPAQKARFLPGIASGEITTSFALTEAEAGSDAGAVRTRAVRDGDFYVLNGTKRYITNADISSLYTVMARTNLAIEGAGGVSAFLVPADAAGVTVGRPERKMGQQGAHICDITFEDVRIPVENRIGAEGEGFKIAMRVLDRGRVHISAVYTGTAERLIEDSVAYAKDRVQFGKPISEHQLVQALIADSKTEALAARALVLQTARLRDSGANTTLEAAATKYFCSEMVGRVADRAVQVFGGAGYIADYGIERFYRDVRIARIYEGTSQIQQLVIARETLKRGG